MYRAGGSGEQREEMVQLPPPPTAAAYSSSLTFSIQSTVLPSSCSTIAMCVMAVVAVRSIHLRRVEEGDAAIDRRSNERDHLPLVCSRAVAIAHSHAPEADGRYFEVAATQFAFLHFFSLGFEELS